mmetsp:Transcript_22318/g.35857  ORF Transcript_22318/g.35857 Transcript_22318/m.35857 type:complete len:239 (+) Transcript_22318:111-827(+)
MPPKKKKDDKKGDTGEPGYKSDPIYEALEPKPSGALETTLWEIYNDILEEKFKGDAIEHLMAQAKAKGETFKPPKTVVPRRPKKVAHLQMMWRHLGISYTDIDCEEQLELSDARGDQTLSFAAFLEIYLKTQYNPDSIKRGLLAAFKKLDVHNRGYVTIHEFKYAMTNLKDRVDKAKVGFKKMSDEELKNFSEAAGVDFEFKPNIEYERLIEKMMEHLDETPKENAGKKSKKGKKKRS